MAANAKWLEENLGPPTKEVPARAAREDRGPDNPELERIEFDSEATHGEALLAARPDAPPKLPTFLELPWPKGLAPEPATKAASGESLPTADVLIVTWTTDEGHALSRVLTPGFDSHPPNPSDKANPELKYWKPYVKNYEAIAAKMNPGCPAVHYYQRLGTYWQIKIGDKSVVVFKSDSHMSQDGGPRTPETTPNRLVWEQIIRDCKPDWVITTGTGGGIGSEMEVGDVVVSRFVSFDPDARDPEGQLVPFSCPTDAPGRPFAGAMKLIEPNVQFLPKTNTRPPKIIDAPKSSAGIITTKNFAYDDTANTFHLKGKGDICEMGDAVLGFVCQELGEEAPKYAIVRNASDPEVDSSDPDAGDLANYIYMNFGRWSSVCSAVVCWAIVAATRQEIGQ